MIDGASPSRHQNSTGEGADACLCGEHVGETATGDDASPSGGERTGAAG